jgi:hypothetical protein
MEKKVAIKGKPLLSKWQNIMKANMEGGGVTDPTVLAAMHAMFMSGAGAVGSMLSQMTDENAAEKVQEIVDEINEWGDTMKLAYAQPQGGRH